MKVVELRELLKDMNPMAEVIVSVRGLILPTSGISTGRFYGSEKNCNIRGPWLEIKGTEVWGQRGKLI